MERLIKILKDCGVETYFIREVRRDSSELFFVKKKLDLRRINNAKDSTVTVFVDTEKEGKKLRGRSDVIVNDSMSDEEIAEQINVAKYAAGFALNPYYELPEAETGEEVLLKSDLNDKSVSEIADVFTAAVYKADNDEEAFINSFELFVNERHVRMVGSKGTDVSYVKRSVTGEFVVQCRKPQDVETYQDFSYDSLAVDEISKLVRDTLKLTKDRASATEMPATGSTDIIISDKYMPELMNFFKDRANAAYVYQRYSNYEIGKNVQGENVQGDMLNICLGVTDPYNEEGIKMIERPFVENGVLKTLHGNQRFSDYLGIPKIGTYSKVIIPEGTTLQDDMKKNCLHIVNFSDFQMDALDGHFKGEIRLAYLYDKNGCVGTVTGGSINGSIFECLENLCFSKETQKLSEYVGPVAVKLKNVAISGK